MLEILGIVFIVLLVLANTGFFIFFLLFGGIIFLFISGLGFLLANPFAIAFICFALYFILNNNNNQQGDKK